MILVGKEAETERETERDRERQTRRQRGDVVFTLFSLCSSEPQCLLNLNLVKDYLWAYGSKGDRVPDHFSKF